MVTLKWNKNASGQLTAEWKSASIEAAAAKAGCRYHKAARAEFRTGASAKAHTRKTWR